MCVEHIYLLYLCCAELQVSKRCQGHAEVAGPTCAQPHSVCWPHLQCLGGPEWVAVPERRLRCSNPHMQLGGRVEGL